MKVLVVFYLPLTNTKLRRILAQKRRGDDANADETWTALTSVLISVLQRNPDGLKAGDLQSSEQLLVG